MWLTAEQQQGRSKLFDGRIDVDHLADRIGREEPKLGQQKWHHPH